MYEKLERSGNSDEHLWNTKKYDYFDFIHFFSAIKSITIYFSAWNTCLIYFEGKERMENFIDQGILYAYWAEKTFDMEVFAQGS